ncbi:hypothetical protein [Phenylobacterium sp.]|uniref:arsenate reductase/protein-tyrosine-phosphatase family protein n=1 Tax=Phenylobacterium sp. TaxID=1871053 RepID=UPI00286D465D|nr:hypothetical protein [Phenylobacterium sp.]
MARFHTRPATTRRFVLLGLLVSGPVSAANRPCAAPRVLFVCPAGTVKSAIAREHLRARAAARGVAVQASSRGVQVEDHVSAALAARLRADRVAIHAEPPRRLAAADIDDADLVIAFDDAMRAPGLERARTWKIPSWNTSYEDAKAAQAPLIEALLDELAARPCPS